MAPQREADKQKATRLAKKRAAAGTGADPGNRNRGAQGKLQRDGQDLTGTAHKRRAAAR